MKGVSDIVELLGLNDDAPAPARRRREEVATRSPTSARTSWTG